MKKISEVSRLTGVSVRTLQYYDDEGLLSVERSENNYRLYDDAALERVWEILIYRQMGLELKKIKKLLGVSKRKRDHYLKKMVEECDGQIRYIEEKEGLIKRIMEEGIPPMPSTQEMGNSTYIERAAMIEKRRK